MYVYCSHDLSVMQCVLVAHGIVPNADVCDLSEWLQIFQC